MADVLVQVAIRAVIQPRDSEEARAVARVLVGEASSVGPSVGQVHLEAVAKATLELGLQGVVLGRSKAAEQRSPSGPAELLHELPPSVALANVSPILLQACQLVHRAGCHVASRCDPVSEAPLQREVPRLDVAPSQVVRVHGPHDGVRRHTQHTISQVGLGDHIDALPEGRREAEAMQQRRPVLSHDRVVCAERAGPVERVDRDAVADADNSVVRNTVGQSDSRHEVVGADVDAAVRRNAPDAACPQSVIVEVVALKAPGRPCREREVLVADAIAQGQPRRDLPPVADIERVHPCAGEIPVLIELPDLSGKLWHAQQPRGMGVVVVATGAAAQFRRVLAEAELSRGRARSP